MSDDLYDVTVNIDLEANKLDAKLRQVEQSAKDSAKRIQQNYQTSLEQAFKSKGAYSDFLKPIEQDLIELNKEVSSMFEQIRATVITRMKELSQVSSSLSKGTAQSLTSPEVMAALRRFGDLFDKNTVGKAAAYVNKMREVASVLSGVMKFGSTPELEKMKKSIMDSSNELEKLAMMYKKSGEEAAAAYTKIGSESQKAAQTEKAALSATSQAVLEARKARLDLMATVKASTSGATRTEISALSAQLKILSAEFKAGSVTSQDASAQLTAMQDRYAAVKTQAEALSKAIRENSSALGQLSSDQRSNIDFTLKGYANLTNQITNFQRRLQESSNTPLINQEQMRTAAAIIDLVKKQATELKAVMQTSSKGNMSEQYKILDAAIQKTNLSLKEGQAAFEKLDGVSKKMANDASNAFSHLDKTVQGANENLARMGQRIQQNLNTNVNSASRAFLNLRSAMAGAMTILGSLGAVRFTQNLTESGIEMIRVRALLENTASASFSTSQQFEFLRQTADKLGVSYQSLGQPFAKLLLAIRGTKLETKDVKELFEGIATAASGMGMSIDETRGIVNAFEQMLSKGKVQAEEVRKQLGNRLPGAVRYFAQALAESKGNNFFDNIQKSMADFEKSLKEGKILTEDVIVRVARLIKHDLTKAANSMAEGVVGQFGRVQNAFTEMSSRALKSGLEEGLVNIAKAMQGIMKQGSLFDRVVMQITKSFSGLSEIIRNNADAFTFLGVAIGTLFASSTMVAIITFIGNFTNIWVLGLTAAAAAATFFFDKMSSGEQSMGQFSRATEGMARPLAKALEIGTEFGKMMASIFVATPAYAAGLDDAAKKEEYLTTATNGLNTAVGALTGILTGLAATVLVNYLRTLPAVTAAFAGMAGTITNFVTGAVSAASTAFTVLSSEVNLSMAVVAASRAIWTAMGGWVGIATAAIFGLIGALIAFKGTWGEVQARLKQAQFGTSSMLDQVDEMKWKLDKLNEIKDPLSSEYQEKLGAIKAQFQGLKGAATDAEYAIEKLKKSDPKSFDALAKLGSGDAIKGAMLLNQQAASRTGAFGIGGQTPYNQAAISLGISDANNSGDAGARLQEMAISLNRLRNGTEALSTAEADLAQKETKLKEAQENGNKTLSDKSNILNDIQDVQDEVNKTIEKAIPKAQQYRNKIADLKAELEKLDHTSVTYKTGLAQLQILEADAAKVKDTHGAAVARQNTKTQEYIQNIENETVQARKQAKAYLDESIPAAKKLSAQQELYNQKLKEYNYLVDHGITKTEAYAIAQSHYEAELAKLNAKLTADRNKEIADEITKIYDNAVQHIQDSFTEMFKTILKNGKLSFSELFATIANQIQDALASVLSARLTNSVKNFLNDAINGNSNSGSGLLSGKFGISDITNLFSGSSSLGISAGVSDPTFGFMGQIGAGGSGGVGSSGSIFSLLGEGSGSSSSGFLSSIFGQGGGFGGSIFSAGGTSLGTVFGNAGWGTIGSTAANLFGLSSGGTGSNIGGSIGSIAGSAMGGPIGSIVGGFAGSILGGLFDGDSGRRQRDLEAAKRTNEWDAAVQQLNAMLAAASDTTTDFDKAVAQIKSQFDQARAIAQQYGMSQDNINKMQEQAIQKLRDQMTQSLDAAIAELENDPSYKLKALQDAQQKRYDEAMAAEIDLAKVRKLNQLELDKFYSELTAEQINAMGDLARAIDKINLKIKELGDQLLTDIGNQISTVNSAINETANLASTFKSLAQGFKDQVYNLRQGNLSTLSPSQIYQESKTAFYDTATKALAGDTTSLQNLGNLANQFLTNSKTMYASGGKYASDFEAVMQILEQAGKNSDMYANRADYQVTLLESQVRVLDEINKNIQSATPDAPLLQQQIAALDAIDSLLRESNIINSSQLNAISSGFVDQIKTLNDATSSQIDAINTTTTAQIKVFMSTAQSQISALNNATSAQIQAVNDNTVSQIKTLVDTTSSQVNAIVTATQTQIDAIQAATADQVQALTENNAIQQAIARYSAQNSESSDAVIAAIQGAEASNLTIMEQVLASNITMKDALLDYLDFLRKKAAQEAADAAAAAAAAARQAKIDSAVQTARASGVSVQSALAAVPDVQSTENQHSWGIWFNPITRQIQQSASTDKGDPVYDRPRAEQAYQAISLGIQNVIKATGITSLGQVMVDIAQKYGSKIGVNGVWFNTSLNDYEGMTAFAIQQALIQGVGGNKALKDYAKTLNWYDLPGSMASLEKKAIDLGLRGFAEGTNSAPTGWALVGERGPELMRLRGGEQIFTHQQTKQIFNSPNNDNVVESLRELINAVREENANLRAQVEELVSQNQDLSRDIKRVMSSTPASGVKRA